MLRTVGRVRCVLAVVGAAAFVLPAGAHAADDVALTGVVRDRDGVAVANEFVQLNAGALFPFTFTGSDGRYALTVAPGSYTLRLAAFGQPCGHDVNAVSALELSASRTLDVTLPNVFLRVRVEDAAGLPIAGAHVTVENFSTSFEVAPGLTVSGGAGCTNGLSTDGSGSARLPLFPSTTPIVGTARLPSGLSIPFSHDPLTSDSEIVVRQPAPSVLSGLVRDRDRAPVANEFVQLNAGALFPFTFTGSDGRYALTVAPGSYTLRLAAFGQPCGHDVNAVSALELSASRTLDVTLPNVFLRVRVEDAAGLPIAGAHVTVENFSTSFEVAPGLTVSGGAGCTNGLSTDGSGSARLPLFPSTTPIVGTARLPSGLSIPFSHDPLTSDSEIVVRWSGRLDATPPTIVAPSEVVADATSSAGAVVTFVVTATDAFDPDPAVACTPVSGALFPIGSTLVACTASDDSGNSATASFAVRVLGANEQLEALLTVVDGYDARVGTSLHDKLVSVQRMLAAAKTRQACDGLDSFVNEVEAQAGKALTDAQATDAIARAVRIALVLGC